MPGPLNFALFSLCLLMILPSSHQSELARCRKPLGWEGESYTEGCTNFTCTKRRNRMGFWLDRPDTNNCCYKRGSSYKMGDIVGTTTDNCTQTTQVCQNVDGLAEVVAHSTCTCLPSIGDLEDQIEGIALKLEEVKDEVEDNGEGIEGVLDWFYSIYGEYNTNEDYTTSYDTFPPLTSEASTEEPPATTNGHGAHNVQVSTLHTYLQGPSDSCNNKTIFKELSSTAKQAILDQHNELRRKVAKGNEIEGINGPQPGASNMKKLVWSSELEAVSQRWADQCSFGHDAVRNKLDGTYVGQNAYIAGTSQEKEEAAVQDGISAATTAWYNEVINPGFDSQSISPFVWNSGAGHYTQVVWADTEELGCGMVHYKEAPWYKTIVVCNYAKGGNFIGADMYSPGPFCDACPQGYSCDDGLCAMA